MVLAFATLSRYLWVQLFMEFFETFYKCVISLELCGKLFIYKKKTYGLGIIMIFLVFGSK